MYQLVRKIHYQFPLLHKLFSLSEEQTKLWNPIQNLMQKLEKYPGDTFYIEGELVGQFSGSVPGTVQAWLK